ncbi:thiol reductase thioredoxin [Bacillus thuringiensis]|nr:thiol reductase thioredoxin [Bacillus thuringiensis]
MMKRLIFMLSAIIVVFGAFMAFDTYKNAQKQKVSPYGNKQVSMQTLDQAEKDPFYQNIILPAQLKENKKNGQNEVVYFFSPVCSYCEALEPNLKDAVKKYANTKFGLYNAYEFKEGWRDYNLQGTPTLIHFKDGKEVNRLVGYQSKEAVNQFFDAIN